VVDPRRLIMLIRDARASDTSLLRRPAGLWTAIDEAGLSEGLIQGRTDPVCVDQTSVFRCK
jgi:hypothetical protein